MLQEPPAQRRVFPQRVVEFIPLVVLESVIEVPKREEH
jgi:hypothetical protein